MKTNYSRIALACLVSALLLIACGGNSGNIPSTALLQSISVTPANPSSPTGGAKQFTAIATYGGGTMVDITSSAIWSSSSPTIASVNASGIASGLAAGTTTITAASGTVIGSSSLTVTLAALQSITVSPSNINLTPGQTQQLTATGTYSDGSTANITSIVTWTAETPLVATVNSTGLATGVTLGTSGFTASIGILSASTVPALSVELEPNNSPATATTLTPAVTMTGQLLSNTDLDYYKVSATGPGAISVAFTGIATGGDGWSISILDSTSSVLSVAISRSIFGSSQTINAGVNAAGTYYVLVQPPVGTTSANNSTENYTLGLSLTSQTNKVELEPNNTTATATALTSAVTMTGQLLSNTDLDYYKVTATGPGAISVAFTGIATGGDGWSISILDSTSSVLSAAISRSIFGSSNTINAGVNAAGTYYVLVQPPVGTTLANNSTENYTLNATVP